MTEGSKIPFLDEEGREIELELIEETKLNGTQYLLAAFPSEDGEEVEEAIIMKDISDPGSEEADYVIVDEEEELKAISKLFRTLLEDVEWTETED